MPGVYVRCILGVWCGKTGGRKTRMGVAAGPGGGGGGERGWGFCGGGGREDILKNSGDPPDC